MFYFYMYLNADGTIEFDMRYDFKLITHIILFSFNTLACGVSKLFGKTAGKII